MEYYYKREFLRDWFERNKKSVTKKEMMQVMGTTSANNLQVWMLEKKPPELKPGQTDTGDRDWLPLRCILRLCSRYDLKISDFIGGAEDIKVSRRRKVAADSPDVEMQLRLAATRQELAETRLDYEQRMNALHARYEEREDMIRKGYDDTIRRLLSRIPAAERQEWPHTGTVSDDGGVYGQTEGEKGL